MGPGQGEALRLGPDMGLNVSLSSAGRSLGAARDRLGRETAHIQRLSHGHYRSNDRHILVGATHRKDAPQEYVTVTGPDVTVS